VILTRSPCLKYLPFTNLLKAEIIIRLPWGILIYLGAILYFGTPFSGVAVVVSFNQAEIEFDLKNKLRVLSQDRPTRARFNLARCGASYLNRQGSLR